MNRMAWQESAAYDHLASLGREGWAWQFLRRNPGYRADYRWFIDTWRSLEATYGAPPSRDFLRWKADPRAWRSEAEIGGCYGETCPAEDDRLLIECWMGAKWGFYKFPIDPEVNSPVVGEVLTWREQPVSVAEWDGISPPPSTPGMVTLSFDLGLPLPAQLEVAKRRLVAIRHGLAKAGTLPPTCLRAGIPVWTRWLRLLDAAEADAGMDEVAMRLGLSDPEVEMRAARDMVERGYRRILLLDD